MNEISDEQINKAIEALKTANEPKFILSPPCNRKHLDALDHSLCLPHIRMLKLIGYNA